MINKRLREYEIIKKLGEGGMGEVYLAQNIHILEMLVVLKMLKDPAQKNRFTKEAEHLSKLDHVNICQIKTFFMHNDELIIVMQYIDGQTLSRWVDSLESNRMEKIVSAFIQVLSGLEHAHQREIFHRDIKPDNILVDRNEIIKIIDFGIARHRKDKRLTQQGTAIGTPEYMAPEILAGRKDINLALSDIYSVGATLYRICCGRMAFDNTEEPVFKYNLFTKPPEKPSKINPEIPIDLEEVILKAMAKEPGDRFSSCDEMRKALLDLDILGLKTKNGQPRSDLALYKIIREIGEGGMGKVYLASNVYIPNMLVVLKFLKDPAQKERFLAEANALSLLDHINICQLKHFFPHKDELVIAMQYIDGDNLAEFSSKSKEINLNYIKNIFLQVLDGLSYAHSKGVNHRDIKPSNIMIDRDGRVKIIDFGIARHSTDVRWTQTGAAVGTPQYMAPEQFTSERLDDYSRCDIYSAGISLYELCCGRLPFEDTNPYVLKDMHCEVTPPRPGKLNPDISDEFEDVIMKAIEKKPSRRFKSASEMWEALKDAEPYQSGQHTIVVLVRRKFRRFLGFALSIAAVLAIAAVVYFGFIAGNHSNDKADKNESAGSNTIVKNTPPILKGVIGQQKYEDQDFDPVNLDDYVEDAESGDSLIIWSGFSDHFNLNIDSQHILTAKPEPGWTGNEDILLIACDPDGAADSFFAAFRVISQPDEIEQPSVYSLKLNIKQSESAFYDSKNNYIGPAISISVRPGNYTYYVYSRDYPIQEINLSVSAFAIDSTFDLEKMVDTTSQGRLAVTVGIANEYDCEIILNGFKTGRTNRDVELPVLISGNYLVDVSLPDSLRLESVKVNDSSSYFGKPVIKIEDSMKKTFVDFYVSEQ